MEWISVKDNLFPEENSGKRYLVFLSGGGSTEYFLVEHSGLRGEDGSRYVYSACINHSLECGTHDIKINEIMFWAELPEVPKDYNGMDKR